MKAVSDLRIGWMSHHIEGVQPLLDALSAGFRINAILTLREDLLEKRSGAARFSEIAERHAVPLFRIGNVNAPEAVDLLRSLDLDALFVIGWSQILHAAALASVRYGCFGAHASLLPDFRGSAPINWALIRGARTTGNTLMKLSQGVDAGDIVDQRAFPITPQDNVKSLYGRVAASNSEMVLAVLRRLASGQPLVCTPQPETGQPLLARRRPEDGQIEWAQPAERVYNFIRALTRPYPGAFCSTAAGRIFVWRSALLPLDTVLAPAGTVLGPVHSDTLSVNGLAVACETGAIVLLEIEDMQGRILSGPELARHALPNFTNY